MKYRELTSEVLNEVIDEVKAYYKKNVVDTIISTQGVFGLIFEALQLMFYHGRYMFPTTYKYRRELTKWLKEYIQVGYRKSKNKGGQKPP